MKLTPILEETLEELKANTLLYKMQHVNATPQRFGPANMAMKKPDRLNKIDGRSVYGFSNRQSLNKLVMLGYAEYQDKAKTIIKYIDKEAIDAELKRKAAVYDRIKSFQGPSIFEDLTDLEILNLSQDELLELDPDQLQVLYDNLLSMLYGAFAHIEELEDAQR